MIKEHALQYYLFLSIQIGGYFASGIVFAYKPQYEHEPRNI